MGRRGGWRSIPPELLVPTAIGGVVQPLIAVLGDSLGGSRVASIVAGAQAVLVLFGLLELRKRLAGPTARWIAAAAALQAVAVLELVLLDLAVLIGIDVTGWFTIGSAVQVGQGLGLAVALSSAARIWRSPLGALLVVTALLINPPAFLLRAMLHAIGPGTASRVGFTLIWLAHAAVLLATYARLGAAIAPAADFPRAQRGALRAARWQRLRLVAVAVVGAAFAVELVTGDRSRIAANLGWAVCVLTAGGTTSGLLGLARSDIPGLSRGAMCIAAFATLAAAFAAEPGVFQIYDRWETTGGIDGWHMANVLASLVGVAVGVRAIAVYLRTLDDRPLARAVERWVVCIALLGLGSAAAVGLGPLGLARPMVAASVFALLAEAIALLILAHVHAQLARRLGLASVVDAF